MNDDLSIEMNNRSKNLMRSALRRLKMPYETVRGSGIKLLSPSNAMNIVTHSVIKVDNSVKKAEKVTKLVTNRVYNDVPSEQQQKLTALASLFGTIRSFSRSAKLIYKNQKLINNQIKP